MCRKRGQTWSGDGEVCGFLSFGRFKENNWNCATLNKLRDMCDWGNRDDSSSACIGVIQISESEKRGIQQGYVVLTWYKDRGATGQARVVWDDNLTEKLTLKTAEFIINKKN